MLGADKAAAPSGFAASIARGWQQSLVGVVNIAGVQAPVQPVIEGWQILYGSLTQKVAGLRRFEGFTVALCRQTSTIPAPGIQPRQMVASPKPSRLISTTI